MILKFKKHLNTIFVLLITVFFGYFFLTTTIFAAATLINHGFAAGAPSLNVTFSVTANNFLLACLNGRGLTGEALTISDTKANIWAAVTARQEGNGNSLQCYWAIANSSGPDTFSANSGFGDVMRVFVAEFSGVRTTNPIDVISTNSGNGANLSSGAFTTTNTDLIIGYAVSNSTGMVAGSGWNTIDSDTTTMFEYGAGQPIGSYNPNAIANTGSWIAQGFGVVEANGGPTPTPIPAPTPNPTPSPTPTPTPTPVGALHIYISQSGNGTQDGSNCSNTKPVSFFNSSTNWGSGTNQIGPGKTAHLCGTFIGVAGSTMLITQGSGTIGSPVTIIFEPGATLTAPYWSTTGAFQINHNYIVVDGGSNGLISATTNGTSLQYQVDSEGIHIGEAGAPHDVEIKNLSVINMCVRAKNATNISCVGNGIKLVSGGGNILIHHNTLHDLTGGIILAVSVTASGDQVHNNTIYNRDAGVILATCGSGITVSNTLIYNNDIGTASNWDAPSNQFHHDGVHLFNCGGTNGVANGVQIYNNYFYGDFGSHSTAGIFIENNANGTKIFNNLITPSGGRASDGLIFQGTGGTNGAIYNNTIVALDGPCLSVQNSTNTIIKNNITKNCTTAVSIQDSNSRIGLVIDNNDYYNTTRWAGPAGIYSSFTLWKAGLGVDANTVTGDPKLDSNFKLQSGSPAISAGANLSSLGISALNSDKAGNLRPTTPTVWDIGAYQYSSGGTPPPATPTAGDLNLDHIVNTLDFSLLNSRWNQNYSGFDLFVDGLINSLDFAILSSNWGRMW